MSLREESRMVRMIIALVEQEIDSKTWPRYCNNERHSLRAALPQHFWPPKGPKMCPKVPQKINKKSAQKVKEIKEKIDSNDSD